MRTLRVTYLSFACVLPLAFFFVQPKGSGAEDKHTRIIKLEELGFTDIDKLDRQKTIFFLNFGNLEEHGPHLPVGSDYFMALGLRDGLVARLSAAHPDYKFVAFPVIPMGECGANDIVGLHEHIGTFNVRFETLRNVAIDLGASIARKGFQNIFLLHYHGCPQHNVAFNDAAAFVSERYKVRMVHITGLFFAEPEGPFSPKVLDKHLGKGWEEKYGWEGHAGAAETSNNLFVRGDLVRPQYKQLPPFVRKDVEDAFHNHDLSGWQGYWGAPALASREMGKDLMNNAADRAFLFAERALRGEDMSRLPLYPANLPSSPELEEEDRKLSQTYAAQAAEIEAWLKSRSQNH